MSILHDFVYASNQKFKLLIGVQEVKLQEAKEDGSKNNILSNFNEIVRKNCVYIPNTFFVADKKFHHSVNGHIVKHNDTSYQLTEKGTSLWIQSVLNRIRKI